MEHDIFKEGERIFKSNRQEDNLGIFDAHDKNLFRAGNTLIPFDVIPCHPTDGFLKFIEDTVAAGHSLKAVRTTHTT